MNNLVMGVICLVVFAQAKTQAQSDVQPPLVDDLVGTLENSAMLEPLIGLEFYPIASGTPISKSYTQLAGLWVGPYEAYARAPHKENKKGEFQYRITIATKPSFFDEEGNATTDAAKAIHKTEVATSIQIVELPEAERKYGDNSNEPVLLRNLTYFSGNDVVENDGFFLNNQFLNIGMSPAVVEAIVKPAKITRNKPERIEATGQTEELWNVASLDVDLVFVIDDETKVKTLSRLTAGAASKVETARGIRIGHPESRAITAYKDFYNERDSSKGDLVVIGNMYLGLFFNVENGKVSSIYLGPGAE